MFPCSSSFRAGCRSRFVQARAHVVLLSSFLFYSGESGDFGGWFCPCHGSHYDISGSSISPQLVTYPSARLLPPTLDPSLISPHSLISSLTASLPLSLSLLSGRIRKGPAPVRLSFLLFFVVVNEPVSRFTKLTSLSPSFPVPPSSHSLLLPSLLYQQLNLEVPAYSINADEEKITVG